MTRLPLGDIVTGTAGPQARSAPSRPTSRPPPPPVNLHNFDFLFPHLQDDPANLLPVSADTVAHLKTLGAAMVDPNPAG